MDGPISHTAVHQAGAAQPDPQPISLEQMLPTQGFPAIPASWGEDRWDDALPPELPRVAPQIFRALRSEGAGSAHDWINLRYRGVKDNNNLEWISLWSAASEVDFAVKQAQPGNEEIFVGVL